MFTGIIEEIGQIISYNESSIVIGCSGILDGTRIGDSIAINGVCLTVTSISDKSFCADVSPETKRVTNLSNLKAGSYVNLERAITLSKRMGGHILTGHIDTIGKIVKLQQIDDFYKLVVSFDKIYDKYVVNKGSISINGISLTIAECFDNNISVNVIPHTYLNTILKNAKIGDYVNIEFDILAKYVEKNLNSSDNGNITIDLLKNSGF